MFFATHGFRKLLSLENNPPFREAIDNGLVPKFLELCGRVDLPKLQYEAAWCLTNLASSESEYTLLLFDHGATQVLCTLLTSQHIEVVEQAIWCLGNMAGDNTRIRDAILYAGVIKPISTILMTRPNLSHSFKRNASWTLANLCRGKPNPPFEMVKEALPALGKILLEHDQEEIITDILWAFSYVSDGTDNKMQYITETGILPRLVEMLRHPNVAISVACLRTLGNILTGTDEQAQMALDAGALLVMNELLSHQKKALRKEVAWCISNITAGPEHQIQAVIDSGVIDQLIHMMQHDDWEIRKEACWAVSNCTASANPSQILALVQKGSLKAIGAMMGGKESR